MYLNLSCPLHSSRERETSKSNNMGGWNVDGGQAIFLLSWALNSRVFHCELTCKEPLLTPPPVCINRQWKWTINMYSLARTRSRCRPTGACRDVNVLFQVNTVCIYVHSEPADITNWIHLDHQWSLNRRIWGCEECKGFIPQVHDLTL